MQRDDPRERAWRGRDEDLELWGRDMDQDDWLRGTYGPGGMPARPQSGRRAWASEWNRGPDWNRGSDWRQGPNFNRGSNWTTGWEQPPSWQRQGWPGGGGSGEQFASGPEPWRGDRDWGQEWWHRNAGFGWTGNPFETRGRQWHGRTTARDYQRSDERIREDVYERLMEHPYIDTTDITVSVSHGEVTLEGTVPDRWEKRLAEDLTEGVLGVTDVHNRLRAGSTPRPERGGSGSFGGSAQSTPATTSTTTMSPSYASDSMPGQPSGAQPPRPTHEPPPPTPTGSTGEPASVAASSGSRLAQLREGMRVVGLDGEQIGQVKEVRGEDFLIDRPMARDLLVPMRFVQNTHDDQVVLSIPARQVDGMNWHSPELLGAPPPAGA